MGAWLSPERRIPILGMVSIVLIVAIVAAFLKMQLSPLFPESEFTVEAAVPHATGRASASFVGVREVKLEQTQRLVGVLNRPQQGLTLSYEPRSQTLFIQDGSMVEEVLLRPQGELITANFEYQTQQIRADILADGRLRLTEAGVTAVPVILSLNVVPLYTGQFSLGGRAYAAELSPSGQMTVIGKERTTLQLQQTGATMRGVWQEQGKDHPVIADLAAGTLSIEEVY